jgi:hypothetical protein
MFSGIRKNTGLYGGIIFYLLSLLVLVVITTGTTGILIYTLDDAYIHMAMAKNFVQQSTWGITQHGFSSTSSSPLWTFLLSISYFITGVNIYNPFILNIIFGCLTIAAFYFILKLYSLNEIKIFIFTSVLIFAAPLPALTYSGMEHIMQIFFVLLFSYFSIRMLNDNDPKYFFYLLIVSPLMIMTRYDMASLVVIVLSMLLYQKKIGYFFVLAFVTLLPVGIYGIISINNGAFFLPNSILVKAGFDSGFFELLEERFAYFTRYSFLPVVFAVVTAIIVIGLIYLKFRENIPREMKQLFLIFLFAALVQLLITRFWSFFRYEAYLAAMVVLITALNYRIFTHKEFRFKKTALVLMFWILAIPLGIRALNAMDRTPNASMNIYNQQYQMARFIQEYYNNEMVVLNDIGFVCFYSDIKLIDLIGLGDQEITALRVNKNYNGNILNSIVMEKKGKISIVYERWFRSADYEHMFDGWVKVEEWTIPDNVVCGDDRVSIFAVDTSAAGSLIRNLKAFHGSLPDDVVYEVETE